MTRLFYFLKPIIPRKIQLYLRRFLGKMQLKRYKNIWPILPGSQEKPNNWSGWPEGKEFAFVLTHDVEWREGHDKCKQLLEIEKELGFKSSFNIVPERYKVDKKLRDFIVNEGFEIGVHGLKHDGKLFRSKNFFSERAIKINQYLKEWNAVGFRAPSMHHNLEWITELDIEYDLSTFDTDPFEPQSDGVGTIFPFWIEGKNGRPGYAERWPWVVAFIFGLLHGFGFAGALAEVGLPEHAIPFALIFFNVGVELGQLAFISIVLSSGWLIHRIKAFPLQPAEMVTSYVIGSVAAYWTIDRVAGFWV